jgi:hypothetical protein
MSLNGVAIIVAILGSVAMVWLGWYTCQPPKTAKVKKEKGKWELKWKRKK